MLDLSTVFVVVVGLAGGLLLLVVVRELIAWYLKINDLLAVARAQAALLEEIRDLLTESPGPDRSPIWRPDQSDPAAGGESRP